MIRSTENGHDWQVDSDYDIEIFGNDLYGDSFTAWITEEELVQMLVEIQKQRKERR